MNTHMSMGVIPAQPLLCGRQLVDRGAAAERSSGLVGGLGTVPPRGYIPHTAIRRPSCSSSRRKTFFAHGLSGVRSKTTRWPSSALHMSM